MNFRNLSAWSIRNPVVPIVLFFGLTILGVFSFAMMKVQNQPDIEFPMVIVSITQPGAAPTEIENQITQKVESSVRTIAGVDTITSTAEEGQTTTQVQFKIGQDINAAVNEVKNAVDRVRGELPEGILEPQVFKAETSSEPIAYFAVSADDMTIEQLSWFIDDTVAKRLLAIPGMAEVKRQGGVDREITVTLDPARMMAQGITATQINAALGRSMSMPQVAAPKSPDRARPCACSAIRAPHSICRRSKSGWRRVIRCDWPMSPTCAMPIARSPRSRSSRASRW